MEKNEQNYVVPLQKVTIICFFRSNNCSKLKKNKRKHDFLWNSGIANFVYNKHCHNKPNYIKKVFLTEFIKKKRNYILLPAI